MCTALWLRRTNVELGSEAGARSAAPSRSAVRLGAARRTAAGVVFRTAWDSLNTRAQAAGNSRMKVLVVGDHALIRGALRGVLDELVANPTVLEASDCRQATELIREHPDL